MMTACGLSGEFDPRLRAGGQEMYDKGKGPLEAFVKLKMNPNCRRRKHH
jgi:hypothetical protein